jgi:hypothetical protein
LNSLEYLTGMTAILSRPIDQIKAAPESTKASAFPLVRQDRTCARAMAYV